MYIPGIQATESKCMIPLGVHILFYYGSFVFCSFAVIWEQVSGTYRKGKLNMSIGCQIISTKNNNRDEISNKIKSQFPTIIKLSIYRKCICICAPFVTMPVIRK